MASSGASGDEVIGLYLDGLLMDPGHTDTTDWDRLLASAADRAEEDPGENESAPAARFVPLTTLRDGMAPVVISEAGQSSALLPLQVLDALFLLRQLPTGTRLHQQVFIMCRTLYQRTDAARSERLT